MIHERVRDERVDVSKTAFEGERAVELEVMKGKFRGGIGTQRDERS